MHLLPRDLHRLEEGEAAVDLEQTPGDVVFLSFSDSELRLLASLREARGEGASLRCASIAQLKHPFSVDLYLEKVVRHARLVVARLLGGKDYWPYGVEELAETRADQRFRAGACSRRRHRRSKARRRIDARRRERAVAFGPISIGEVPRICRASSTMRMRLSDVGVVGASRSPSHPPGATRRRSATVRTTGAR